MKALVPVLLVGTLLFVYQNCGQSVQNSDFLDQTEQLVATSLCEGGGCTEASELLWLKIREYEPYRIHIATVNFGHFNVGGRCGVGTFGRHSFLWELREGFGSQRLVGQGFQDDRCEFGQFIVPIVPNQLGLVPDQRYQLSMELVGITSSNREVSNPTPNNQATLDIIFTSEPPQ